MATASAELTAEQVCALDLPDRNNLDPEMQAVIDGAEKTYGFVPHFLQVFATDNDRLRALMVPYLELRRPDSGLSALEHEMIAVVCAATNGCAYCTAHHGALLRGQTKDRLLEAYLATNYKLADLSPRHRAMLDFAVKVTVDAESIEEHDRQALRDVGFGDEAIWYIAATAAFYAGANRLAVATGLRITPGYVTMHR